MNIIVNDKFVSVSRNVRVKHIVLVSLYDDRTRRRLYEAYDINTAVYVCFMY